MTSRRQDANRLLPRLAASAGTHEPSWEKGQYVSWWLIALVVVLVIAVLGAAAYALYAYQMDSLVAATSPSSQVSPEAALAAAYTLQQAGRLTDAISGYEGVLKMQPNNLAALYNKGVCSMEIGNLTTAEQSLRRTLELSPKHALAALALGELLVRTKRYDEIPPVVEPAALANPEMADLQALDGLALEKTGRRAEAVQAYRNALRFAPTLARAKSGLARLEASGQ